jgi:hypothetical protein
MKHALGFETQIFGSRTCTWKLTAEARAKLETPQNRATINKMRKSGFIGSKFLQR